MMSKPSSLSLRLRCKVVVIGEAAVGKTSLVKHFLERTFPSAYLMTMGAAFERKSVSVPVEALQQFHNEELSLKGKGLGYDNSAEIMKAVNDQLQQLSGLSEPESEAKKAQSSEPQAEVELYIFDIGGHKLYEKSAAEFVEGASAFILVYDVTKPESFTALTKWLDIIKKSRESKISATKGQQVGVLVSNKNDLVDIAKVPPAHGEQFAKKHKLEFFQLSAMHNDDADLPFLYVADKFHKGYLEKVETVKYTVESTKH